VEKLKDDQSEAGWHIRHQVAEKVRDYIRISKNYTLNREPSTPKRP
jgi:hypothetical protein